MAVKIALANLIGGCGKTISTMSIASILSDMGHKVLVVDCDNQGHLSNQLKADMDEPGLYELLMNVNTIDECIQTVEYVDIVSSDDRIMDLNTHLNLVEGQYILKRAIEEIEDDYDYILFDTAPRRDNIFANVILSTDYVLIPFEVSTLSINAVATLVEAIEEYQEENSNLQILGAFEISHFNKSKSQLEALQKIKMRVPVLMSNILLDFDAVEFLHSGERIGYEENGRGIIGDYNKLVKEILEIK